MKRGKKGKEKRKGEDTKQIVKPRGGNKELRKGEKIGTGKQGGDIRREGQAMREGEREVRSKKKR